MRPNHPRRSRSIGGPAFTTGYREVCPLDSPVRCRRVASIGGWLYRVGPSPALHACTVANGSAPGGLAAATSALELGSPLPRLHWDRARPCHLHRPVNGSAPGVAGPLAGSDPRAVDRLTPACVMDGIERHHRFAQRTNKSRRVDRVLHRRHGATRVFLLHWQSRDGFASGPAAVVRG